MVITYSCSSPGLAYTHVTPVDLFLSNLRLITLNRSHNYKYRKLIFTLVLNFKILG
ncbi:hypothetical protein MACK_003629 [Theileria orientalis]|uniref:Uncharacterized protein n=1 Tax=Theileria orientalis TaxID=68886 RepID=A0A976SJI1_THEOR|nr:hypothetical protein MACK_003629 [Theileria orientalis]